MVNLNPVGQSVNFSLGALGLKQDAEKLLANENESTLDGQVEAKVFETEAEALQYASRDAGDEAIVQTESGQWAVVDVKSQFHRVRKLDSELTHTDQYQQRKVNAEAIFDPTSTLTNRLMSRSRVYDTGRGYREAGIGRIELLPEKQLQDARSGISPKEVERALALSSLALEGKLNSFNSALSTNTIKGSIYQNNLATIVGRLDSTLTGLDERIAQAEKQGSAQSEIDTLKAQRETLITHRGILRGRLLTGTQSGREIPGLTTTSGESVKAGTFRNDFETVRNTYLKRRGQLQDQLRATQNPEIRSGIESQMELLKTEYSTNVRQEHQVKAAALAKRMRIGALATINKSLSSASQSLKGKTERFTSLHRQLLELERAPSGPVGPRQKVDATRRELEQLKGQIESEKRDLLSTMKREARVFANNSSSSAADARAFLAEQIAEIEALNISDPASAQAALNKINTVQAELLEVLSTKAEIFEGISPDEGKMFKEMDSRVNEYIGDYRNAKAEAQRLESRVERAEALPDFAYNSLTLQSVSDAREVWKPGSTAQSGVDANAIINGTYNHLDAQFSKYLGDPPIANWMTFGKYASREAGTQIQNLEASLEALETFKQPDGSMQNDKRAVEALIKVMKSDRMVEQALRMVLEVEKDVGLNELEDIILRTLLPGAGVVNDGLSAFQLADKMIDALGTLRGAMVKGNTRIYENIAAPFQIYMQAESRGENGLEALKAAGYDGPHRGQALTTAEMKDPQGFVMGAFTKYKEAKNISDKVEILKQEDPEGNAAEIAQLMQTRQNLIHEANLLIGMQEQLTILQAPDIFDEPMVSRLLGAMSGTMSLTDANGKHELLPKATPTTASWADFETRMGLKEVPPGTQGAIQARMPNGDIKHFIPEYPEGTISQYFQDGLSGAPAQKLIVSPPRNIETLYEHSVGGKVTLKDRLDDLLDLAPLVAPGPGILVNPLF